MERKAIRQGPNTLMVSLPIKWAKRNKISKGDSLTITEQKESLIVSRGAPKEEVKKTRMEIKPGFTKHFTRAVIANLYKKGYDLVEIKVQKDEDIDMIQHSVNTLIGYEITEQEKGKVIVENISKELESEFDSYLRKTFFMMLETGRIIRDDFAQNKFGNEKEILQLNFTIKKFTDVCKRALNRDSLYPGKDKFMYLILWSLEKIANEYMYFYRRAVKKRPKKKDASVLKFLEAANGYFKSFYENFYTIKKKGWDAFANEKDRLYYDDSYSLIQKAEDSVLVMHIANAIRMTYNMVNVMIGLEF